MEDPTLDAVLAAIGSVQKGVDDLRSRLGDMVTRAEHIAEMKQVNARLDRVQASVADERAERVEHVRNERESRNKQVRVVSDDLALALAKEHEARLASEEHERGERRAAEERARARFWKVVSAAIPVAALVFGVVTYLIDAFIR